MKRAQEALKHLKKLRQLIAQKKSPFYGMTHEEIIFRLRKTREELWDKKLALHP